MIFITFKSNHDNSFDYFVILNCFLIKIEVLQDKLNFESNSKIIFKRCLLKSFSYIGTQQKRIIDYRKITCMYSDETAAAVGRSSFGDVTIGIKFQLAPTHNQQMLLVTDLIYYHIIK